VSFTGLTAEAIAELSEAKESMKPLVRDLYKRFILAGRVYPQGLAAIRARIKKGFMENSKLNDDTEVMKAVGRGRYWVRELVAVSKLHKYRAMRQRYNQEDEPTK
jgi:hypothetical protein